MEKLEFIDTIERKKKEKETRQSGIWTHNLLIMCSASVVLAVSYQVAR